jgi:hypothetical protein
MRKKMIVFFLSLGYGLGVLSVISGVLAALNPNSCNICFYGDPYWWVVPIILVLALGGFALVVTAWIGALVKQGKQQQWRWFIVTILSGLATPILSPFLSIVIRLIISYNMMLLDLLLFLPILSSPLLGGICLLLYLIRVPETPRVAVPTYAPNYQPIGGYLSTPIDGYPPMPIAGYPPMPAEPPVQEGPPQE